MKQAWGSIVIFVSCWRCRPCVASGFPGWDARLCCWALFLHQKCQVTKVVYFLELAQYRVAGCRTQTFLGDSPVFSVLLGLLVYGAAIGIYNSLIRPGLDDPVLSVGVPIYIIWLSTTVTRQYSHVM